jgi:hypothetical protein
MRFQIGGGGATTPAPRPPAPRVSWRQFPRWPAGTAPFLTNKYRWRARRGGGGPATSPELSHHRGPALLRELHLPPPHLRLWAGAALGSVHRVVHRDLRCIGTARCGPAARCTAHHGILFLYDKPVLHCLPHILLSCPKAFCYSLLRRRQWRGGRQWRVELRQPQALPHIGQHRQHWHRNLVAPRDGDRRRKPPRASLTLAPRIATYTT